MDDGLYSLAELEQGQCAQVRTLQGGREFCSRLASMGLAVGSQLQVMQNRGHGPVLVLVLDTRIALGRNEAMKVEVEVQSCAGDEHG